jgi:hypothetical protein
VKKLMNGVPAARANRGRLADRPLLRLDERERQHERRGQRGARGERRDAAQRRRRRVPAEVHDDAGGRHDRRPAGIEAGVLELLPPGFACLEVHRHESQPLRDAEAEVEQALTLPGLRTGSIDLEHAQS